MQPLSELSKKVTKALLESSLPFCLWLEGDVGAGKTTFVKSLFEELGLNKEHPVTSPTYTYLQEYEIKGSWYAHMDFYRFAEGSFFDEEELMGMRDYQGLILEWPSNVRLPESMLASHRLVIDNKNEEERDYSFYQTNR